MNQATAKVAHVQPVPPHLTTKTKRVSVHREKQFPIQELTPNTLIWNKIVEASWFMYAKVAHLWVNVTKYDSHQQQQKLLQHKKKKK